ncbi:hypothetical protein EMCRGX_G024689 [Ephydatia muelleri]
MVSLTRGAQNDCCEGITALLERLFMETEQICTSVTRQSQCCSKNVCEINAFTVMPSGVNQTHGRSVFDLMREWLDGRLSEMEGAQVFCEGCNQRLLVQQRELSFPSILIIHCSRVSADNTYRKLKTRIEVPRSYQLTHPCSSVNSVYEISALVLHHGKSANEGHFSLISLPDYNCSKEVKVKNTFLDRCNSNPPPIYLQKFHTLLRTKGAKPHSSFQLEKCDLTSLISGEWISSRITAAYLDLLQNSVHGMKVISFDPTFLPAFKAKGYSGVRRCAKAARLLVEGFPCLHTQDLIHKFRSQMAHELSLGALCSLQSAHVEQAIIKESSTEHQAAHVENENSDDSVLDQSIRKDHDMNDGYEDDGNIGDCDDKGDEDEDEERDPNFLVPTYINQPDPDDLCALKWGKDHYMRYVPSMKRKLYTKQQCPFERDFIRKVVKEMEAIANTSFSADYGASK